MESKEKIGGFVWKYIGIMLVQLIPFFCFIIFGVISMYVQKADSFHAAVFHNEYNSAIAFLFGAIICYVIVYLGIIRTIINVTIVEIARLFWCEAKDWLGWIVVPYGKVNDYVNYKDISRELACNRAEKAKKVYMACCICKYILILAVCLPDIKSHVVVSLVSMMIFLAYYVTLDIIIGRANNKRTCQVCFHSQTKNVQTGGHSSTQTVTEYMDEKIGTLKIGESKIGVYTEKTKPYIYDETTEYSMGVIKCSICGNVMGKYSDKSTWRISQAQKSKIYQDIYNSLNK